MVASPKVRSGSARSSDTASSPKVRAGSARSFDVASSPQARSVITDSPPLSMPGYATCEQQLISTPVRCVSSDPHMFFLVEAPIRTSSNLGTSILGRDPCTTQITRRFAVSKGVASCLLATKTGPWVGMTDGTLSVCHRLGSERHSVRAHSACIHALCAAGSLIVWSTGADGLLKAWTLDTVSLVRTCRGHTGSVHCLVALPSMDGVVAAVWSGSEDQTLAVWASDGTDPVALTSIDQVASPRVMCAQSSPKQRVWVADMAGGLHVWHGARRSLLRRVIGEGSEAAVGCMTMVDEHIWCGDDAGGLRIYDGASTSLLHRIAMHRPAVIALAVSSVPTSHGRRGKFVWSSSADHSVQVWRILEDTHEHVARVRACIADQHSKILTTQQLLPRCVAQAVGRLSAASKRSELLGWQVADLEISLCVASGLSGPGVLGRAAGEEELGVDATERESREIASEVERSLSDLRDEIDRLLEGARASCMWQLSPSKVISVTSTDTDRVWPATSASECGASIPKQHTCSTPERHLFTPRSAWRP